MSCGKDDKKGGRERVQCAKMHAFIPRPKWINGGKKEGEKSSTMVGLFQLPDVDPAAGKVGTNGRRAFERRIAITIAIVGNDREERRMRRIE